MNPGTHRYLPFYLFLIFAGTFLKPSQSWGQCDRKNDSLELVKLHNATGGANWKNKWVFSTSMDKWYGVKLNTQGCVTCIDLDGINNCNYSLAYIESGGNKLIGELPTLNLPSLSSLILSNNQLSGSIPNFTLPSLQVLSLSFNKFHGTIPNFNLPNLTDLDLGTNRLEGSIPDFNLPKLEVLSLLNNLLMGSIPGFSKTKLKWFNLSNCQMDGTMPNFNLPTLQYLYLTNTNLQGSIPNLNLPNLTTLIINDNKLTVVPKFNQLPKLLSGVLSDSLSLYKNKLTFEDIVPNLILYNALASRIPYAPQDSIYRDTNIVLQVGSTFNLNLGIDPSLNTNRYQWYKNGQTYGSAKTNSTLTISNLKPSDSGTYRVRVTNSNAPALTLHSKAIRLFVTSANPCRVQDSLVLVDLYKATNGPNWKNKWDLSKPMNGWYNVSLSSSGCVTFLNLSDNGLSGSIPESIGNLSNLEFLALDKNDFSGTIPSGIGNLSQLETLILGDHPKLSGGVPKTIGQCKNLSFLSLQNMNLSGSLPEEIGNLKRLKYAFFSKNKLTRLPTNIANLDSLVFFNAAYNQLAGSIPNFSHSKNIKHIGLDWNKLTNFPANYFPKDSLLRSGISCFTPTTKSGHTFELCYYQGPFLNGNAFTFEDLLPFNSLLSAKYSYPYWPQDSIYRDTLIRITGGQSLSIDLGIDSTIVDNQYTWTKNSQAYKTITGSNKLAFAPIALTDVGTYYVRVTNPRAPQLTLYGRRIRIEVMPSCRKNDSLELVKLYNATDGPNWTNKWDLGKPINTWYGINLNAQGCVTSIYLQDNQLHGNIPAFNLPDLKQLFLYKNKLIGTLPSFNLPNLEELSLHSNELSGSIPNFNMPLLKLLSLGLNQFSGNIPNFNLPRLEKLGLRFNQLSGVVPNFNFPNLSNLRLNGNQLGVLAQFNYLNKMGLSTDASDSLTLNQNRLSFDDILPNLELINKMGSKVAYAPQDSIFRDTLIRITEGQSLSIDLGIDANISDNQYTWTKNSQAYKTITGSNKLTFAPIALTDAGTYYVRVTNPRATLLTLYGRRIRIEVMSSCRKNDSLELVKLYNATDGPNWKNKWDLGKPMSGWWGIKLNPEGCVSCIDMDGHFDCIYNTQYFVFGNELKGVLPGLNLPSLSFLDLSKNQLSGNIPDFKSPNLTELYLAVNKFSGDVPNFNLPKLEYLSIYNNQLNGSIANFYLPNLKSLDLSSNNLNGSIPDFNLPNLEYLILYNNQLSENIPNFNLPNLKEVNLSNNELSGNIPDFNLPSLTKLELRKNQLSGTIPNFKLPNLTSLNLSWNKLSGNIPDFNYPKLEHLSLFLNNLSGSIPDFKLPSLITLSLQANKLSGSIPDFKSPNLEYLGLSYNQLSGDTPNFNLPNLKRLYIDSNRLSYMPKFDYLWQKSINSTDNGFLLKSNSFTFDDIIPNLSIIKVIGAYAPQDSIYRDTLIRLQTGQTLNLDLGIDASLTTNRYQWYKNDQLYGTVSNSNKFSISNLKTTDAGIYRVQVTNPAAPALTLYSKAIRLEVSCANNTNVKISSSAIKDTICAGSSLTLTASGGSSYKWNTGQTTTSINLNITQTQNFQVTITDANNCTITLSKNIVQAPLPQAEISALDYRICTGGSMELRTPPQTNCKYEWLRNGQSLGAANSNYSYKATQTCLYTVRVSNQSGCATLSKEFNLQEGTLPKAEISAASNIVCTDSKLSLNAVPVDGAQYQWFRNGSSVQGPSNSGAFEATQEGNYTLRVSLVSGCAGNSAPFAVQRGGSSLGIRLSPLRDTICRGDSLYLSVSGGLRYTWSTNSTSSGIAVKPSQNTLYTVTVEDAGNCKVTLSQNIVVARDLQAQLTLKEEDCGYVLVGSATGGRGPYAYRWSNGQTQAQLRNPAPGAYNLQIQDSRKCVGRANISVDSFGILAGPPQHFDANCGETNGQIVLKLRQDRGPFSFEWMPFDQGTGDSIRTGLGPGEYTAIITDNQDCMDTVMVTIEKTEDCDKDFLIFRSFSPNGDGVNETFVIQAKQSGGCPSGELNDCHPNNELIVFNRWGDIVYRKRGYESDWGAEDLPGGAYFFMFYPDREKPKVVVKRALTVVK